MAKLKNIIRQLSEKDFNAVYNSLIDSNAEKSAYLLKSMREKSLPDSKIMEELEVNTNAYYTLRSRLNQKIEEYLLQQMENPRTDILKKVANINEIIFTKKRAIAIATLKKLEKELLDYDLSNELTIVYKSLKKLQVHSPDYFNYSQLYNRHVAYMLAVDKAEDLVADYFKKYGHYTLTQGPTDLLELSLINKEVNSTCSLYDSHRLYVYKSCINIWHRLFVEPDENVSEEELEPVEDMLLKVDKILDEYHLDSIYYHLRVVFEYLKLEYYNHYHVFRKAEKYFEEVNENIPTLMSNYSLFTFPSHFLNTKLERALRLGNEQELYEENDAIFAIYEPDMQDIPKLLNYIAYRALSCYYAGKYSEAARWINNLLNEVSLKKYPMAQLEIKVLLALQYCLMNDFDLFNQLINSIQRQIRILGKDNVEPILSFTKALKIAISETKRQKEQKIRAVLDKYRLFEKPDNIFSPTMQIRIDDEFIIKLSH
ncbi:MULTISPECIES: hypothetical protein [Persicobacter]|uniref:Uncharacterized protein n=1 Tax=Persicobacter diffluens TaxID=981 RepID=A0AAN4VY02_9BACT|nr:hypothetical protein [Persicobacter sp. CCB-QB2]GJM62099.1 hypothetical protein PEDI_26510 [Persicobacter diffluens]